MTVGLNTVAQLLLKSGAGEKLLNSYLMGGVLVYGVSTVLYVTVLSKVNLSIAYPVVIGLTIIATTIFGATLLGEKVTIVNWIGVGLVFSGVFAIASQRSL
jgi:multidrug transporter EmrE-like cation transporter